jgi:hypothetical protein
MTNMHLLLAILSISLSLLWLHYRYGISKKSSAKESATARTAEASMLLVLAFGLWLFALRRSGAQDSGYPLLVIASIVPFLFAAWIAFRGAAVTALILMIATLSIYGFLAESGAVRKVVEKKITFDIAHQAKGVEIWVNDVLLGKTPRSISAAEFRARVPLAEAPEDFFETTKLMMHTSPRGQSGSSAGRWIYLDSDLKSVKSSNTWNKNSGDPGSGYYLRATWHGEEARFVSLGSGSGSNENDRAFQFDGRFPGVENHVVILLQQAWLHDLVVDEPWFDAALAFGVYGWRHAQTLVGKEDAWQPLLETWALRFHGFRDPKSGQEAMNHLQGLAQLLNQSNMYYHQGPEVYAARALARHMDGKAFAHWARPHVRKGIFWIPPEEQQSMGTSGGSFGTVLIGQTAWWLDQRHEQEHGGSKPNPIEEILVPEIIRYGLNNGGSLACAAALGGPHILRYAQRQLWSGTQEQDVRLFRSQRSFENKWLFLVSLCQSAEADEFRLEKAGHPLLEAARKTLQTGYLNNTDKAALQFLFPDARDNRNSLAWQFWSEFQQWALRDAQGYGATVHNLLIYLSHMDPLDNESRLYDTRIFDPESKAEQVPYLQAYVLAFRAAFRAEKEHNGGLPGIEYLDVPRAHKREIYRALELECRNAATHADSKDRYGLDQYRLSANQYLMELGDASAAREYLQEIHKFDSPRFLQDFSLWLRDSVPGSPLLALLVRDDDPELRKVALSALERRPDAANRALLAILCEDPNEEVRAAAQEIQAKLDTISSALVGTRGIEPMSREKKLPLARPAP